ncbi:hypothetical protein DM02DRAFT_717004 [Periconia macrospinosa]|uniref:Peroxisomal membrane protein PEX14 n=1 Tax=Periconia macrospinosa TaxID=97972 RepID=A0A2V1DY05_9PLEO|nr:hypothetical protein DM02DRAFT_717004 [Periconia macrospinosa]
MAGKPTIPSWQRAQATPSPPSSPSTSTSSEYVATPSSEQQPDTESLSTPESPQSSTEPAESQQSDASALRDQAARFLQDPTIQDAPRERKVAFLESKGVGAEEIEKLLGKQPISQDASPDLSEAGENAWSTAPRKQTSAPVSAPPPPPPRDIPPIVTYPEFLAQPTQQPPLITTQRLLNTAYITGGLISTMYGLSKYIIAPMTQNLAEARHEFSTHAHEQLDDLNKRLKDSVSIDPATKIKTNSSDVADDVSEADSDPTELYHRDFGTQTSPGLSRRPSLASTSDEDDVVKAHENRLKIITSHLRELQSSNNNDTTSSASLQTKVSDLTTYLSEMSYMNQYYSAGAGGFYSGGYGGLPRSKDGKDDQIEVLRSDIRAVKGVFLSARNFPAGGRGTIPAGRSGV